MRVTKYGARLKPWLPLTLDSVKAAAYTGGREELHPGVWFITKPSGAYGPLWLRLYHAWLIISNRAMAIQFSRDHFTLAGQTESARPEATMFARVKRDGSFSFDGIRAAREQVLLSPSDVKQGAATVRPVLVTVVDEALVALVDPEDPWSASGLAWVIQHPDGSLWLGTLGSTREATLVWCPGFALLSELGFRLALVQFTLA